MPRKKRVLPKKETKRLSESYVSLIVGFVVVFVAAILLVVFAKNRTYERINTAISIFQEPSSFVEIPEEENNSYVVKAGDTLWSISEKVYGSGYNWVDLVKANNLQNPEIIEVGTKLKTPKVQKISLANAPVIENQSLTKPIAQNSYTVQKGDYLWDIAVRKYGDGYKWPEIARANSIPNPDLIYANSVLKLP